MSYSIEHVTEYAYSQPVFLEPQTIRLIPLTDAGQHLDSFAITVDPEPDGMSRILDLEGNSAFVCWFSGVVTYLRVLTLASVTVTRANPFEFISTACGGLPYRYSDSLTADAQRFRQRASEASEVHRLAEKLSAAAGGDTNAFLSGAASEIRNSCSLVVRPDGDPWPAAKTLAFHEGSCRDFAVLFMELCRDQGIAARFVSGYHAVLAVGELDLHAWAEVYLEGGGWRGFDPTTGLAVSENHIVVARAPAPHGASPLCGNFRGSAAAQLSSTVRIHRN
jgi:transglutaminase-like putative cysteine protease